MAAKNMRFTATVGATGTVMPFTLYGPKNESPFDANGLADLTGWTLTVTVKRGSSTVVVNAAACDVAADQVANKSEGSWDMGDAVIASDPINLPPGDYRLKIKGVDGSGNVRYFPTHPVDKWATLTMIEA